MKKLKEIFQALLGVVAMILTALIALGRLTWRGIKKWWKKRKKWIRGTIVTIFVLFVVGFVALLSYAWYDSKYGRCYWKDEILSKNIEARAFNDHYGYKFRVYNNCIGEYTTQRINWISDAYQNDSLAVYAIPNKRGYINVNTGKIVIDAELNDYRKAWVFSEGMSAVMKDGKIGFINAKNEIIIPFQFDYSDKCRMWDFGYLFHDGYCIMTNKDGDLGLIDTAGNWVVEPAYDEIWAPNESGYRMIVKDGKYGVLDARCNIVYPAEYAYVEFLSDGFVLNKDGKKWQVDFEGNIVQPFMFDATYYLNYPIGYDDCGNIQYAFADYIKYEVMNRYGIMNRITGEPVTFALYLDINMLSKDLFEVQDPESYNWYLVDTNGNVVKK